jgi:hypothetical protein
MPGGKSLASQHRLKVVDWPVVALAAVPASDGIGAFRLGKRAGSPNPSNSTQHNADATTQEATPQRYSSLGHTSVRCPTYSGWVIELQRKRWRKGSDHPSRCAKAGLHFLALSQDMAAGFSE